MFGGEEGFLIRGLEILSKIGVGFGKEAAEESPNRRAAQPLPLGVELLSSWPLSKEIGTLRPQPQH